MAWIGGLDAGEGKGMLSLFENLRTWGAAVLRPYRFGDEREAWARG
jgi:hypothetical protein